MVAHRGEIDAGLLNDVAHRDAVESALGEQALRGEKDSRVGGAFGLGRQPARSIVLGSAPPSPFPSGRL